MKIKKSKLVGVIENVVRECISERKATLNEASYKVASDISVARAIEDKARTIQTDPKINEEGNANSDSQRVNRTIQKLVKGLNVDMSGMSQQELVAKLDTVRQILASLSGEFMNEASYKVASDISVDRAIEDKAREIQTDPKVNETAYKTQGPSYKTFKDSPQFPKAVNDPKNR